LIVRLFKRTSNFINKIGKPEDRTTKKLLAFFVFLLSKEGRRLVKAKVRRKLVYLNILDRNKYHKWISKKLDIKILEKEYEDSLPFFKNMPVISIVMPVYNPPVNFLSEAIESVKAQLYPNWELCIGDDHSTDQSVIDLLTGYEKKDERVHVCFRKENGHISASSNSALQLATGAYVLFMDHDDLLTPNCLFEVIKYINAHPEVRLIYSDEDKVTSKGIFREPHFKPDWAPDNLLSRNYMGHVVVMDKNLVNDIGGFRLGFEGSQDYDILLRATEKTDKIGHIPKVLYHWRIHEASVASGSNAKPYAYIAARNAINEALIRRGSPGTAEFIPDTFGGYRIKYKIEASSKVSILIPTKDNVSLLKNTIDSVLELTDYPDYEIIVLNNNSTSKGFFELMREYEQNNPNTFRCVDANFPFNFSKLTNLGVAESKGEYILLLNNDVKVIQRDWLTEMVSFAQQKHTGAVGVKLLYPDDTIQHGGIVLGIGGSAAHVFVKYHRTEGGYHNYLKILNNYSAVTAACMMFRKTVYEEVGGMDESLKVDYNDVDLCLKFIKHGYYNVYVPDVELYHYESSTRGAPYQSKETWKEHKEYFDIFANRWSDMIKNDPFYNPNLSLLTNDFNVNYQN